MQCSAAVFSVDFADAGVKLQLRCLFTFAVRYFGAAEMRWPRGVSKVTKSSFTPALGD